MAATPLEFAGETMLPSVSLPSETAVKLADAAAADPELEPLGLRSMAYGLLHWPPRPLHPLDEKKERKLAHSLSVVFPRITAPPARSLAAIVESRTAGWPARAKEPAVVCMRSPVSMLSLSRIGMPCSGLSTLPRLRIASSCCAIDSASGLSSITELRPGPRWSSARIRLR